MPVSGGADGAVVTLCDPRVTILLPRAARPAATALATLDAQLGTGLAAQREPMLGQIRIAWWREALARGTSAAPADPVLQALVDSDAAAQVEPLLDAWEAVVVAPDAEATRNAAAARGDALFAGAAGLAGWPRVAPGAGACWGMVSLALWWGRRDLLPAPGEVMPITGRALLALDRWARVVASAGGERRPLREGWSLMTAAVARG